MSPNEHRSQAAKIREEYRKLGETSGFNHLLPRIAEIHEEIADEAEQKITPPPIRTDDDIVVWAQNLHSRVMGVKLRPRPITKWDVWVHRQDTR
jgi:hypothetical protein